MTPRAWPAGRRHPNRVVRTAHAKGAATHMAGQDPGADVEISINAQLIQQTSEAFPQPPFYVNTG